MLELQKRTPSGAWEYVATCEGSFHGEFIALNGPTEQKHVQRNSLIAPTGNTSTTDDADHYLESFISSRKILGTRIDLYC